jgi:hypothetical protein
MNNGGIIYMTDSVATIDSITAYNFTSVTFGGAYYGDSSTLTLTDSDHSMFTNNMKSTSGGVLYFLDSSIVKITGSTFTNISAANTGCVSAFYDSIVSVTSSQFTDIYSFVYGGILYGQNTEATFNDVTIDNVY